MLRFGGISVDFIPHSDIVCNDVIDRKLEACHVSKSLGQNKSVEVWI
jgi:hypothetical protein